MRRKHSFGCNAQRRTSAIRLGQHRDQLPYQRLDQHQQRPTPALTLVGTSIWPSMRLLPRWKLRKQRPNEPSKIALPVLTNGRRVLDRFRGVPLAGCVCMCMRLLLHIDISETVDTRKGPKFRPRRNHKGGGPQGRGATFPPAGKNCLTECGSSNLLRKGP